MSTQIFKATYSNVPVYEMPCKGVAVMRRRGDAWLNATQILKVAGFDKPQRTRVLEREVQKGVHEKVQGGYGKYQGTWVPMERGLALAQQYGVDHLLQPIIDYVPSADSPPLAPKHLTNPPNRAPKKAKLDADPDHGTPPASSTGKSSRASAAQARQAAAAAAQAQAVAQAQSAQAATSRRAAAYEVEQNKSRVQADEDRSMSPTPSDATSASRTPSPVESVHSDYDPSTGPPGRKRKRDFGANGEGGAVIPGPGGPPRYARLILDYFVSETTKVPDFLISPPPDFDANVVIDDDGHTALHWACAMGRIRIVRLLLTAGADIFRANLMGQTALMRSVMFTNNYDLRKFPELFELLHRSTINIDRNDRTVFHYVVDLALQKGKTHAARYYMETILNRLADFPREVADILNFQDEEGETPLTLAARARSRRLVKLLLDHGAETRIANKEGKTAEDYIMEDERFRAPSVGPAGIVGAHSTPAVLHYSETGQRTSGQVVPQVSDLLESLASTFDFELRDREGQLDQAKNLLTTIQSEVTESKKLVDQLKQQTAMYEDVSNRCQALENELKEKMSQKFREGWDRYVRGEEQRALSFGNASYPPDLAAIYTVPDPVDAACDEARAFIGNLQEEKKDLFDEFVQIQSLAGTGQRMDDYRKLLALSSGVSQTELDAVVDQLVEQVEEEPLMAS